MLPSSSPASLGFVVSRFVNISVAIIELPNKYSNTIWNAAKNINRKPVNIIIPERRSRMLHIM